MEWGRRKRRKTKPHFFRKCFNFPPLSTIPFPYQLSCLLSSDIFAFFPSTAIAFVLSCFPHIYIYIYISYQPKFSFIHLFIFIFIFLGWGRDIAVLADFFLAAQMFLVLFFKKKFFTQISVCVIFFKNCIMCCFFFFFFFTLIELYK